MRMRVSVRSVLRSAAAASVLSVVVGSLGAPIALAAQVRDAAVAPAETPALKRLPAGRDELVFRGENASRSWSVYLSPTEAARGANFQLAILNAVVVLPERSTLKLTINGRLLTTLPVRSPDRVTALSVKIPAGVLTPGVNRVQMSVALTHRVDCSVKATYELWALLDPAKTGIVMDSAAAYSIRSLDEIAAEPLAEDGTTRIHLRSPDNLDANAIDRAGRFIDALVRRAGLFRPVVDVGPEPGRGVGFDVVLTEGASQEGSIKDLRVLGREGDVTLGRDPTSGRLVVVLSAANDADLDARISELDKAESKASAAQTSARGVAIDAGARRTFAELGFATESFAGRHYVSSVDVTLPADFFPASYDRSRLVIDGGHSSTLDQNSELIFRVNGAVVSSLWLTPGKAEQFTRKVVELPLRSFHPGHNELAIEGFTASPLDQQCDVVASLRDPRLTIAKTSELEFPQFAHLGTLPQLPSALSSSAARGQGGRLHLYLPDLARGTVGTALSLLANMASTMGRIEAPLTQVGPAAPGDVPGIVIAPLDQLSESLATPLRKIAAPAAPADEQVNGVAGGDSTASSGAADAPDQALVVSESKPRLSLAAAIETGEDLLKNRGFFFSGASRETKMLQLGAATMLIGAVNPEVAAQTIGGVEIPQVTRDPSQWLVVTAQRAETYEAGFERLVANGQWTSLAGQAISLDLDTNQLRSVQPSRVAYVAPTRFVLSDIRPVLGGIVSDNILISLGALMLLLSILGLSTHALIRRMGAR
jgi:cellulose synthase operon protein B